MSKYLTGADLSAEIDKLLAEPGGSHAVAFWGRGSEDRLPDKGQGDFRLICNLMSGGTNPYVIEKMKLSNVKHLSTLHAKVYAGAKSVVVASANASINGLGLEGLEQAKWLEAGIQIEKSEEQSKWFEKQWNKAEYVDKFAIEEAIRIWERRTPPPINSFADFDPNKERLPLLYWGDNSDWDISKASVEEQLGPLTPEIEALVDDSLWVQTEEDAEKLPPGTWLLVWQQGSGKVALKSVPPEWFCTGRILKNSFVFTGEDLPEDSVLRSERHDLSPFPLDEMFLRSFYSTINSEKFIELRISDDAGPWFTDRRIDLTREFWKSCKSEYLRLVNGN
ncbi:phospholipase D family protein [Asticcacaulis sp. AC402]|uniref:phospholipase D family protein n=1 Tax=Asticcacaulis sp. AC402 TaxID=1282361 RepID=UPI0012DD8D41|nr:phospholipase D family protein [Asticcacaulis sp. AC402]